nr:hypothetical protein [Nostoc sp. ChiQUE02]MDZ8234803.1 hypothetical protein [Nostoc sp. ChiQUE02]
MEPLTAGAIALVTLLLNKTLDKTSEIIVAKAFEQAGKVIKLLKHKSPDTAIAIEAAVETQALPPGQREDIGEAVLVETIESAAQTDPEIKAAVEALAIDLDAVIKVNPELAAAVVALTEAVKTQQSISQAPAKIAETIGINKQNISGGEVYQTFGQGNINIDKRQI